MLTMVKKNAVYAIQCTIHRRCSSFLHVRVLVPAELTQQEAIGSSETGFANGCDPPCGCLEPNQGLLQKQGSALNLWAISPAAHRALYNSVHAFQKSFSTYVK